MNILIEVKQPDCRSSLAVVNTADMLTQKVLCAALAGTSAPALDLGELEAILKGLQVEKLPYQGRHLDFPICDVDRLGPRTGSARIIHLDQCLKLGWEAGPEGAIRINGLELFDPTHETIKRLGPDVLGMLEIYIRGRNYIPGYQYVGIFLGDYAPTHGPNYWVRSMATREMVSGFGPQWWAMQIAHRKASQIRDSTGPYCLYDPKVKIFPEVWQGEPKVTVSAVPEGKDTQQALFEVCLD